VIGHDVRHGKSYQQLLHSLYLVDSQGGPKLAFRAPSRLPKPRKVSTRVIAVALFFTSPLRSQGFSLVTAARPRIKLHTISGLILLSIMLSMSANSAAIVYAARPIVNTLPPQNVTSTSADLYASINPKGQLTTWTFHKEPEGCPGCVPPDWCPGAGPLQPVNQFFTVHCTVHNLSPSKMYGYFISATNVDGTTYGDWVRFTTAAAPTAKPIVKTSPPTMITSTSAQLNGLVNPGGTRTAWTIYIASLGHPLGPPAPPGCNSFLALPQDLNSFLPVSCTVSGLTPSTSYHFQVQAVNNQGSDAGSDRTFATLAGIGSTDWAMLSAGPTPSSPHVGDSVVFHASMTVMSTTVAFPQSVGVECQVDGVSCGSGQVDFPGPTGAPLTVSTETPWTATAGAHTLTWRIYGAFNDPNPQNDMVSTTFTVESAETSISTQTSETQSLSAVQSTTTTSAQATTQVQQTLTTAPPQTIVQTVTQTQNPQLGFLEILQQNSLATIGLLGLLLLVAVAFAFRRRSTASQSPHQPLTPASPQKAVFCGHCGSRNPFTSEFCSKCGSKLLKIL